MKTLLCLLLLTVLAMPCAATELTDALPPESRELLAGVDERSPDLSEGWSRLQSAAAEAIAERVPASLRLLGLLLSIVLLCALVHSVGSGKESFLRVAGVLAVMAVCAEAFTGVFALTEQTLTELQGFSTALLAALAASMAAAGGVGAGTALYAGSVFFLNLLLRLISELLLPLVYGCLAASAAGIAMGSDTLKRVGELLKWVVTTVLKLVATVFVAYLTISGVVSGSADSSAVKAVKLAVSTAVPVVGSIISDASETVLVSAGLVKNAVGVFGMLGAFAVCAVPFVRIGLRYLALKLAAALSGVVDTLGLSKLLDALSGAMGMALGMTAVALLLTLFSCLCALRMVSP